MIGPMGSNSRRIARHWLFIYLFIYVGGSTKLYNNFKQIHQYYLIIVFRYLSHTVVTGWAEPLRSSV